MPVYWSELQLVWPPDLFLAEARALPAGAGCPSKDTAGMIEWLLQEAFADGRAAQMYREARGESRTLQARQAGAAIAALRNPGSFTEPAVPYPDEALWGRLQAEAHALPLHAPRRLWSERSTPLPPPLDGGALRLAVARTVLGLANRGYFHEAFVHGPHGRRYSPRRGQRLLQQELGRDSDLWPLGDAEGNLTGIEEAWDDHTLLDLIEVLHHFAARPRWRMRGDDGGWEYDEISRPTGRAVYRWWINKVLDRSVLRLRLAETGPEVGQLVKVTGDARDDLVDLVRGRGEPAVADRVEHAVAQFRRRGATRETKREATRALADVLEQRRDLLEKTLFSNDSGALFSIANNFDIRHMNAQQHTDYNPLFLDWVFWWYLATIDLTNRLLAQQDTS